MPSATKATATSTTFVAADYTTGPGFQGWYLGQTPEPLVCPNSATFTTSGIYADCSGSISTPIGTGCDGRKVLLRDDENNSFTCPGNFACDSYKIYPTEESNDDQGWVRYACLANWGADSIYRTLPARFETATAAPERTGVTSNTISLSTTKHLTTSTATPTATAGSSTSNSSGSSISGGAIGGIVVGCIAAIVIVALIFLRKRVMACFGRNKQPTDDESAKKSPQTESMPPSDPKWQALEMPAEQNAIHEIGSSQAAAQAAAPRPPVVPQVVHEIG